MGDNRDYAVSELSRSVFEMIAAYAADLLECVRTSTTPWSAWYQCIDNLPFVVVGNQQLLRYTELGGGVQFRVVVVGNQQLLRYTTA